MSRNCINVWHYLTLTCPLEIHDGRKKGFQQSSQSNMEANVSIKKGGVVGISGYLIYIHDARDGNAGSVT
jgi:hypothetical protein